jgi:hypothetical protein
VTVPIMRPLVGMEGGHRIERSEGVSPGVDPTRAQHACKPTVHTNSIRNCKYFS